MAVELWAVENDPNSHGSGGLIPDNPLTVYIENQYVIELVDPAYPDNKNHPNPASSSGSSTVFVYGNPVHRNNDSRTCGASTVVVNQSTVFAGG